MLLYLFIVLACVVAKEEPLVVPGHTPMAPCDPGQYQVGGFQGKWNQCPFGVIIGYDNGPDGSCICSNGVACTECTMPDRPLPGDIVVAVMSQPTHATSTSQQDHPVFISVYYSILSLLILIIT